MGNKIDIEKLKLEEKERILKEINDPRIELHFSDPFFKQVISASGHEMHNIVKQKKVTLSALVDYFHKIKQKEQNQHQDLITIMYDRPKQRAEELDQLIGEKDISEFPLAGYIFSIKDSLIFKDTPCTSGFAINVNNQDYFKKNTRIIKHLIQKGALFISKGNVPQGLFSLESFNHVYGEARNPYDITRTPGGSSGGEAALVRLGLCNVALGSDIAGSLRIPALYCGIVTLKPTALRLPVFQMSNFFDSQEFSKDPAQDFNTVILPTIGPLARTVEDCEKMMEILAEGNLYNIYSSPLPWTRVK